MPVYVAEVEVKPLAGSDAPSWALGAFVCVIVHADSEDMAVFLIENELTEDHYELLAMEPIRECEHSADFEWLNEADAEYFSSLFENLIENPGLVYYGQFQCWGSE